LLSRNALIVTDNDKVYVIGLNRQVLGVKHEIKIKNLTIVEKLLGKMLLILRQVIVM